MLNRTLDQINALVAKTDLTEQQTEQLKSLNQQLHQELQELAKTDPDHANDIANYVHIATEQALMDDRHQDWLENTHDEFRRLEVAHPKISNLIHTLTAHLSSLGI